MSDMPPDMEAYAEEVRRRVEAANDPQATHYAASPGLSHRFPSDVGDAEDTPGVMGAPTASRAGGRPVGFAALAGAGAVLLALGLAVFLWAAQRDDAGVSPTTVAGAVEGQPPFASTLAIDEMSDAYMGMWDDGSIYEIIPDTDEGRDYFRAFMYTVTDLKLAAEISGGLSSDQEKELTARELHFLALEDLEIIVDITFNDGTNFTYDGHPPARTTGG